MKFVSVKSFDGSIVRIKEEDLSKFQAKLFTTYKLGKTFCFKLLSRRN